MRDLMNDVASVIPAKWRVVGIQLELPSGTLDSIQQEHAGKPQADKLSFETVLNMWKGLSKIPYTWVTIIDALKAPLIGENELAEKLKAKYIRKGERMLFDSRMRVHFITTTACIDKMLLLVPGYSAASLSKRANIIR